MVRMVLRRVHILARVLLLPLAVSRGNHGLHGLHGRHVLAVLHLPLACTVQCATSANALNGIAFWIVVLLY